MFLARCWFALRVIKQELILTFYTFYPLIHYHNTVQASTGQYGKRYYCPGCRALLSEDGTIIQRNVLMRTLNTDEDEGA